jgi:hypothetical protein
MGGREMIQRIAVTLAVLLSAAAAQEGKEFRKPAPLRDKDVDRLIGTWNGEGQAMGMTIKEASADGTFSFEGWGILKPLGKDRKWTVYGFDDFGSSIVGEATVDEKGFETSWTEKGPEGEMPHKAVSLFKGDTLEETFSVRQGDQWSDVGKVTFKKAK